MTARAIAIPAPGMIDLWLIDLAIDAAAADALCTVLDAGELARAVRFAATPLRTRFVAAHASVRAILAGYLGLPPAAVPLVRDARGKPGVADGRLSFNVSHSGDMATCAVAAGGRVGVDIELVRPVSDADKLVERYFSPREADEFLRLPACVKERAFLGAWTRKEAFMKATGEGMSRPLDSFEVTVAPHSPFLVRVDSGEDAQGWWMRSFDPGPGYFGTVAHDQPIATVDCRPWTGLAT